MSATGRRRRAFVGATVVAAGVAAACTKSVVHPVFPVTQSLTGHVVAIRAVAASNDVTRDARYLTNQEDSGSRRYVWGGPEMNLPELS